VSSSSIMSIPYILNPERGEYQIVGGLTIDDKAHGVANAIFDRALSMQRNAPTYKVEIRGKKLISPATPALSTLSRSLIFTGAEKLAFNLKGKGFVEIIATKGNNQTVSYVNTYNCIADTAYYVYSYLPKQLTSDEAYSKLLHRPLSTHFKPEIAVYNCHGVAVFGWDKEVLALYWANPHEDAIRRVQVIMCEHSPVAWSAASSNGSVHFLSQFENNSYSCSYLNGEIATRIQLQF
jgi:hypothetical protein